MADQKEKFAVKTVNFLEFFMIRPPFSLVVPHVTSKYGETS